MLFFDFLYYHIAIFYSGYNEKGAESTSSGIVGGFLALNVMTIMFLYLLVYEPKPHVNKLAVIVLAVIFQVYTYIRYNYRDNHSVDVIEQKWSSKTDSYRKWVGPLLLLYGAGSLIVFIGLAIYWGSRNS